MRHIHIITTAWLLAAALQFVPFAVNAENSQDFGQYVVHFNALSTDMLPPKVARQYNITRSRQRGMLNITVLKKVLGTAGQPTHAKITAQVVNLAGQIRGIELREIREGTAIYYIGEFSVAHEETLKFNLQVKPEGTTETFTVKYAQEFYVD